MAKNNRTWDAKKVEDEKQSGTNEYSHVTIFVLYLFMHGWILLYTEERVPSMGWLATTLRGLNDMYVYIWWYNLPLAQPLKLWDSISNGGKWVTLLSEIHMGPYESFDTFSD